MILVAIIPVTNPRATARVIGVIRIYNATRYTIKSIPRIVKLQKIVSVLCFHFWKNVQDGNKFFVHKSFD